MPLCHDNGITKFAKVRIGEASDPGPRIQSQLTFRSMSHLSLHDTAEAAADGMEVPTGIPLTVLDTSEIGTVPLWQS
eukprot:4110535-Amphidinium_carterae.1